MIAKWDTLKDLLTLQDQVNRIFDLPALENGTADRDWVPAVDVLEKAGEFEIRAEIPGMDLKDIGIHLEADRLVLKGEKKTVSGQDGKFHQVESVSGRFVRSFTLPNTVDRERIRATYQQGVLTLTLPKREEIKPRTIQIEEA